MRQQSHQIGSHQVRSELTESSCSNLPNEYRNFCSGSPQTSGALWLIAGLESRWTPFWFGCGRKCSSQVFHPSKYETSHRFAGRNYGLAVTNHWKTYFSSWKMYKDVNRLIRTLNHWIQINNDRFWIMDYGFFIWLILASLLARILISGWFILIATAADLSSRTRVKTGGRTKVLCFGIENSEHQRADEQIEIGVVLGTIADTSNINCINENSQQNEELSASRASNQ